MILKEPTRAEIQAGRAELLKVRKKITATVLVRRYFQQFCERTDADGAAVYAQRL
jgi:hypothetical protein